MVCLPLFKFANINNWNQHIVDKLSEDEHYPSCKIWVRLQKIFCLRKHLASDPHPTPLCLSQVSSAWRSSTIFMPGPDHILVLVRSNMMYRKSLSSKLPGSTPSREVLKYPQFLEGARCALGWIVFLPYLCAEVP